MLDWNPKEDVKLQEAIKNYLIAHNYRSDVEMDYEAGIDFVQTQINEIPVLIIGLPPVSNYSIEETEHAKKYLGVAGQRVA